MSVVSPDVVRQVALLARLRLEGQDLAMFAAHMDEILAYVQQLQGVDTTGIEPTSHVLPLVNVLRSDTPAPSLPQETVISLAPAARPPFIAVPKVIEA